MSIYFIRFGSCDLRWIQSRIVGERRVWREVFGGQQCQQGEIDNVQHEIHRVHPHTIGSPGTETQLVLHVMWMNGLIFYLNFDFDLDLLIDQIWSLLHSSKDMDKSWLAQNLSKVFQTQLPKYFFWELLSNRVQLRLSVY